MAETKQQIKDTYPLPAYNYRVSIKSGGESATISFAEVSGLSLEHEPVVYKHGFSFAMGNQTLPGMKQPLNITMRKGVTRQGNYLYDWMDKAYNKPFYDKDKRDIVIDLCDETGIALVRWKVQRAQPTKLDMPVFDAATNEVAIETMELIAHGLKVEYVV